MHTTNVQPYLEKIPLQIESSIAVKREVSPFMDYPWHYHPEHEIIFLEKSYGIRFMGNHIGNFQDGDLMFVSSNLPHVWKNDNDFYQGNKDLFVDVYVIHFKEDIFGTDFFNLPEFVSIKRLFQRGQQGILIKGEDQKNIARLIKAVVNNKGIDRITLFLQTLRAIAEATDYELLSSLGYLNEVNTNDTERLNRVMNFMMSNYAREITLDEVAQLCSLTTSSFCRYFKSQTQKTFTEFLNEVRILNACKLLAKNDLTITEICYKVGYNNISHFNRQFKLVTGITAKAYHMKYKQSII